MFLRVVLGAAGTVLAAPGLIEGARTGRLVAQALVIGATALVFVREHGRTRFRWAPVLATVIGAGFFLAPFQFGLSTRALSYAVALDLTGAGALLVLTAWLRPPQR